MDSFLSLTLSYIDKLTIHIAMHHVSTVSGLCIKQRSAYVQRDVIEPLGSVGTGLLESQNATLRRSRGMSTLYV